VVPATPFAAPPIGVDTVEVNGVSEGVNAALGRCTSPFSFVGFPVLVVPVTDLGALPVGVQLVAKPGDDGLLLDLACVLEQAGIGAARTR
jgi:Asp-tRNA(Asn)/Glu-tRNA(Gln) amidotransferase A subunit family amidase